MRIDTSIPKTACIYYFCTAYYEHTITYVNKYVFYCRILQKNTCRRF